MGTGDQVVGYVRVSTDDQGANGNGLEAQRQAIQAECDRRGWQLLRIEEDVLSGRTISRPGLEQALSAVRSGEVSGIVVAKLDRLSRSVVDFGRLLEEAKIGGWNIVGLDFGLDLSTPQGELVANVLISVAQWERRIIGQRTREGLAVVRSRGVRLGGPTLIAPDVAERIRSMRRNGQTLQGICDVLTSGGVSPPRGKMWRPTSLRAVLRSQSTVEAA